MKLPKERTFDLTTSVVVGFVSLENLVHALKEKGPELSKRAIVELEVACVSCIVMIGFHHTWAIQLQDRHHAYVREKHLNCIWESTTPQ